MADEMQFVRYGPITEAPNTHYLEEDDFYFFQNNGADILAVAHLDSVDRKNRFFRIEHDRHQGRVVRSPTLDDRLGVYVIAELLPKIGIQADVLLTVGEERGKSTARYFTAPEGKQYNWMFQFDRMGDDVVMYRYHTLEREQLLRSVHAWPSRGMFSDICDLENMRCAGFNWGVGYHDYHGPRAWASLDEMFAQAARFCRFWERYRNLHMVHEPSRYISTWGDWKNPQTGAVSKKDKKKKAKAVKGSTSAARFFRPSPIIIPDIDEQLQGRKRGSRRGPSRIINPYEFDQLDIEFARCPECTAILEDEEACENCGWERSEGVRPRDGIYGMTEREWRRYQRIADAMSLGD
jgi:hypothetical protein